MVDAIGENTIQMFTHLMQWFTGSNPVLTTRFGSSPNSMPNTMRNEVILHMGFLIEKGSIWFDQPRGIAKEVKEQRTFIVNLLSRNSAVEFFSDTEAVVGSNPTVTTQCLRSSAGLEHFTFNEGVTGSNPVGDTIRSVGRVVQAIVCKTIYTGSIPVPTSIYTSVAQLVEHWSPKPGVGGSSPSRRAKVDWGSP